MGRLNFLVEGGSASGKSTVCAELRRRGHHAVDGDRELAYQGDPASGEPVTGVTGVAVHAHHLWRVDQVRALVANATRPVSFFCGGSRNSAAFIGLFDAVFVLEVDDETLRRRLDGRTADEWGGRPAERELVERLHRTRVEIPPHGIPVDAIAPLSDVVDEILRLAGIRP